MKTDGMQVVCIVEHMLCDVPGNECSRNESLPLRTNNCLLAWTLLNSNYFYYTKYFFLAISL